MNTMESSPRKRGSSRWLRFLDSRVRGNDETSVVQRFARWLAFALAFAVLGTAHAHKPSDSYLALKVQGAQVAGQWDIALRDLEVAIGLDSDGDGNITWGELKAKHSDIASYALARLALQADAKPCPSRATGHLVDDHSDGAYAVLRFEADCGGAPDAIDVRYSLFFDFDTQHKGLLRLEADGQTQATAFAADRATQRFELRHASRVGQFLSFGREGVWHIWIGIDHILFIVSLLLPAVLILVRGQWRAAPRFGPAFWDVFRVVTSFTVAHSITLSLAALGVISLPSRLVESAIAASVALAAAHNLKPNGGRGRGVELRHRRRHPGTAAEAPQHDGEDMTVAEEPEGAGEPLAGRHDHAAANNLKPIVGSGRWMVAFLFGLVHGFGFASVLTDLGLPKESLLLALVGFNLGVEVGQLAIVSAFLPIAFALRSTLFYRKLVMSGGSAVVLAVALVWLAERALNFKILPV